MAKTFFVQFGSGNPQSYAGLSPTFITFISEGGTNITGPTISEVGVSTGLYKFSYAPSATFAVVFNADGGAALTDTDRYITGVLDPVSIVDQKIGASVDSFGSTSADPSSLYGLVNRLQELLEGDAGFNKSTGVWTMYNRGSSTILRSKTLTNSVSEVTKT
jgi:hypothetical protein